MIEVLKLALKALNAGEHAHLIMNTDGIKDKVRQAIAELESQEPVAWADHGVVNWIADKQFKHASLLYAHPPQRTWVGLTRMDLIKCGVLPFGMSYELCQAIEAKLKQKNMENT
jgi:hypothetical protein